MPGECAGLSIRPARPGDEPQLLRLVKELAEYEKLAHAVVADEADIERALFSARPEAWAALAEIEGETAGIAIWFYNFSTFAGGEGLYLEDLYVRPRWRGRGIGFALLRWLARDARERGCRRMEWAVLDWNEPAIEFYRGLGAESMDDWTVFRLSRERIEALASGAGDD